MDKGTEMPLTRMENPSFSILEISKILWNFFMTIFVLLELVSTNISKSKMFFKLSNLEKIKLPQQEPLIQTDLCLITI